MRIHALLSAVALSVIAASPTPAAAIPAAVPRAAIDPSCSGFSVQRDGIRLRTEPKANAPVVGFLDEGDVGTADRTSGPWTHLTLTFTSHRGLPAGSAGWVATTLVTQMGCSTLRPTG